MDIVVPVRNEERDLAPSVRRLVAYLRESFPFRTRVTIADNGSTDATWAIAGRLARELPEVRAVRMDLPGRGRALRSIWSQSDAEVLAYMDVDLSTDLNALLPLVAPLLSGHSDLAIGTRLTHTQPRQTGNSLQKSHTHAAFMQFQHNAYFDREGAGPCGAVHVVPLCSRQAAAASGTGPAGVSYDPAGASYDMNAAFMSLELHDGGIHVVWSGAGGTGVTGVRLGRGRVACGGARPDQDQLKLAGDALLMVLL